MKFTRKDGQEVKTHQPSLLVVDKDRFYVEIYLAGDNKEAHEITEDEYKRLGGIRRPK